MRFLVLIASIVIVVAIFSTQNSEPVSVSFFVWTFQASLAIVVFLAVMSGIVLGILISFFLRMSKKQKTVVRKEENAIPEEPRRTGP
jgi:uncharacterized integral membrane protein